MKRLLPLMLIVAAGVAFAADRKEPPKKEPDVIYVPTPQEVVDEMLKMADVNKGDVVYDLGCGDGRIVITAVKKFGARRGVGVDINAELLEESKENAKKAGVGDKVEFRKTDVLDLKDLGDATVVMLYMGEDVNLRLRPILQKSLKPGSRIVSHQFKMGDWKPERTETIELDDRTAPYNIFLWTVGPK